MTYELAKQLADAGFPYKWEKTDENNEPFEEPTLSELIEACGDGLWNLTRISKDWSNPELSGKNERQNSRRSSS